MSVLMFRQTVDAVYIVTDTLATGDDKPFMFQSKVFLFPHANMIAAVTGSAQVGERWASNLRGSSVFRDIADVDTYATSSLLGIEKEVLGDKVGEKGTTTTIYHFGFEPDATSPVRYVYRSTSGFASERHVGDAFAIKPEPVDPWEVPMTVDEMVQLVLTNRVGWEHDDSIPIFIGGELYLTTLQDRQQSSVRIHRFSDYDEQWEYMLASVKENNAKADDQTL